MKNLKKLTDEQRRLITKNHNIIYSVLNKKRLDICNYYDIAAIAMCKAALTYDPARKVSFATYSYKVISYELSREITKEVNHRNMWMLIDDENTYHASKNSIDTIEDFLKDMEIKEKLLKAVNVHRHAKDIAIGKIKGKTDEEISQTIGMSRRMIITTRKRMREAYAVA